MYDLELGVFFNSRDVVFSENEFPFAAEFSSNNDHIMPGAAFNNVVEDYSFQHVPNIFTLLSTLTFETTILLDHDESSVLPPIVLIISSIGSSLLDSHDMPPAVETNKEPHATDIVENLGRGHHIKFPSTKL